MTTRHTFPDRPAERIPCPDCDGYGYYVTNCASGETATCDDCSGVGTIPNPTICLRTLRDAINRLGVPADLYQSGGGCATIGIGRDRTNGDYTYNVGPGFYWDGGTANRDELGSGPASDDFYMDHTGAFKPEYTTTIGDDETIADYAARIVAAYNTYRDESDYTGYDYGMIAETALDAAILHIQNTFGEPTGDYAGVWFASPDGDTIRDILRRYAEDEAANISAPHCGWRHCTTCNDTNGNPTRRIINVTQAHACCLNATTT